MRDNDTLTWIITDHLGSTTAQANADSTLKTLLRYTASRTLRPRTLLVRGVGELRAAYSNDQEKPTDYRYTRG